MVAFEPSSKPIGPQPWDGFIAGSENALASASVSALARGEGDGISPLVLHGPSGVGKSRLLAGLVAERLIRRPESAVAEIDGDAFAAVCGDASNRTEGWSQIRSRFRNVDLFVLDGLERIGRVPPALEELSHTLDALETRGASVAISSRTAPGQWTDWPSRLVNRLLGGLSVRIDPPSLASRRRYLLDRSRALGLSPAADAVDSLAEAADGYRTLDGWLARLSLSSRVENRPVDRPMVEPYLADEAAPPSPAPTLETIARAVAAKYGISLRDLRGPSRHPQFVEPRHLAMHLARLHTDLSFVAIGAYFGDRDSATVRHACRAAAARIANDPAVASALEAIGGSWRQAD